MPYFFDMPDLPPGQIADGPGYLRYEDVSQDGRLNLLGLPPAMGNLTWRKLLGDHPLIREGRERGIVPILSRFVFEGAEGTIPVGRPLDVRGAYQLAHTVGDDGQVNRLMLNMWASARGVKGRTYAPPPPGHGERVDVGRIFAEHVFTRPFAPPDERKVLRFRSDGLPEVPETRHTWRPLSDVLALPDSAAPLDAELTPALPIAFGLFQTDSNQHVNSLVYPRLFEQAVLGRLAELGQPTELLSRYCEIAYRKPSFAGDRVQIVLQTYRDGDRWGAVGAFCDQPIEGDANAVLAARPRCIVHVQLTR